METNYPSSGSKGSAGIPGTGTSGGTANTTGSSASSGSISGSGASKGSTSAAGGMSGSGSYDDIGSTSSTSQGASHSGGQSGAWTSGTGTSGSSGSSMGSGNLRDELSSLKRDLDDLMSRATSLTDRELSDAKDKMMMKFGSMRTAARGMADQARTQLNQGVDITSDYVKEKPLQSVAIAAGLGLLIGALMRGRD